MLYILGLHPLPLLQNNRYNPQGPAPWGQCSLINTHYIVLRFFQFVGAIQWTNATHLDQFPRKFRYRPLWNLP